MIDLAPLDRLLCNETDVAYRRRARILVRYLDLHEGDRVLDCGCGMGFYLRALSDLGRYRLAGIDGDVTALAEATKNLSGRGVSLTQGDIHRLPFADSSFDKVICSEVLEHLEDDRAGLREIRRVLRPGGILAITVPNAAYPFWYDPINRVLENLGRQPLRTGPLAGIWALHQRLYTRTELLSLVRSAAFDVEDCRWLAHYGFPFTHTIVYAIGKPLIQRRLLPGAVERSVNRFHADQNAGSRLNPINWLVRGFVAVDRFNDRPGLEANPHAVNVVLKARKPG